MSARTAKMTTLMLAASCGILATIGLLQYGGWGKGYSWLSSGEPEETATEGGIASIEKEPIKLPPATDFAETRMRPIFNDDRKPTPIATEEKVADEPPPPEVPLNVTLTGVILTPEVRLVMLRDNMKNQALALKEGMPMPGDAGGWTLTTIKPRSAIFKGNGDESIEVELMSLANGPKPPTTNMPGNYPPPTPNHGGYPTAIPMPQPSNNPEMANENRAAEDLQRRIEERRRQIREEAERLRQQQEQQNQQSPEEAAQQ